MAAAGAVMRGLRTVPREAVPGLLDVLMEGTGVDASTLLSDLLRFLPEAIKDEEPGLKGAADMEVDVEFLSTYVGTLLHLLNASEHEEDDMARVVWNVCMPLLRNKNPKLTSLQYEVTQMLANAVAEKRAWNYIKTLVAHPCLNALDPTLTSSLPSLPELVYSRPPPVSVACQLVAALLSVAVEPILEGKPIGQVSDRAPIVLAQQFCKEMVSLFMAPAMAMLSQPLDGSLRHHAMLTLLPPLLKATRIFDWDSSYRSVESTEVRMSSTHKIWQCCKALFMHGSLQRHDSYMALAAFAELLLPPVHFTNELLLMQRTPQKFGVDTFDIRDDPLFWDEVKAGLVEDDPLTRKRALYVLKRALPNPPGKLDASETAGPQPGQPRHSRAREEGLDAPVYNKRDKWAEKEAVSLGLKTGKGEVLSQRDSRRVRWDAFVLLYETLEEYGTHLIEAAWAHQMSVLLPFSKPKSGELRPWANPGIRSNTQGVDVDFNWISVLFQRGFDHKNPQVRRLVLQSFLELEWACAPRIKGFVPEDFVLGPLLRALDDPVHHRDFGVKGIYNSDTAVAAAKFIWLYSGSLHSRNRAGFVQHLAKALVAQAPCRAGLMTLCACLEAAAVGPFSGKSHLSAGSLQSSIPIHCSNSSSASAEESPLCPEKDWTSLQQTGGEVLEDLKLVVEDSKRHFNPRYRAKVYAHVLATACALVQVPYVPVNKLAQFLSSFPQDLLAQGGLLHGILLGWLHPTKESEDLQFDSNKWLAEGLMSMVDEYLRSQKSTANAMVTDEELEAWGVEAERWARLLAVGVLDGGTQLQLVLLVERYAAEIYQRAYMLPCMAEKVLLLLRSLLKECPLSSASIDNPAEQASNRSTDFQSTNGQKSSLSGYVAEAVENTLDEMAQYAMRSAGIFWEYHMSGPTILPGSVTGKLGGPSQRRLPSSTASAVLQGVLAVMTLAESCIWYCEVRSASDIPESVISFLWYFAWEVVTSPASKNETGAEIQVGAYEALTAVCGALAATVSPHVVAAAATQVANGGSLFEPSSASTVDVLVRALLVNVAAVLEQGALARSRRAVLARYKWGCLDYLLSIPKSSVFTPKKDPGEASTEPGSSIGDSMLEIIFQDAIDSLESAGEEYLVPLLRSIRWLMHWGVLQPMDSSDDNQEKRLQIMWALVQSGWATMADCNKRKVAPTAAFLSAILHPKVFGDMEMHEAGDNDDDGPLKWLLCRLIDQGSRSPRTMRLTALHVTGLWLQFPATTSCYIEQLKLLSLHGGEMVDEELDGELVESQVAAREYLTLIQSSDPELNQTFTNSEMYVRITVAIMIHQLWQVVEDAQRSQDVHKLVAAKPAAECGRKLLLELLTAVVEDPDLSKELYKKKSAIHRRKVRAWQMLCILCQFVSNDEVEQVSSQLEVCLYRNNMPSVRQYMETFAVQIYLRFPYLVGKYLIPVLQDYNMKTQALSSYVLIATNVLMNTSPASLQESLLRQVLPAILPFMTTHHHNLRSFTQVLLYRILQRFLTTDGAGSSSNSTSIVHPSEASSSLDRKCLHSLAAYLEGNADCTRMRNSVEKYLDMFDPLSTTTPRGIFCSREGEVDPNRTVDDLPFECAPVAVLDQISHFLNEAREGLREAMAADAIALNAEQFGDVSISGQCGPVGKGMYSTRESKQRDSDSEFSTPTEIPQMIELSTKDCPESVGSPLTVSGGTWDFQKKIASLRFNGSSLSPGQRCQESSTICRDFKSINNANLAIDAEEDLLLASMDSRVKELVRMRGGRQELIVVASLLSRIPNLAGLARTCEVFKTASLVVADASVVEDRQFQLISVTAERWVPIVEVPEAGLPNFLQRKKKEGFSLLGLEQTANSVSIDEYMFPKKAVLVLGREKEGIPVDLIQVLDACVEIPQLGVIRSLNVHVSGAIAVWEYTRQHRPRFGLPSSVGSI